MSRRYRSERIEVLEGVDGEPVVFRWRGRRYAVRAILASWVEALPWWVEQARVDQGCGQRHVWRVEAAARTGTTGVYDLYRISLSQRRRWGLERVID
jgi:hypothetical protein